MAADFATDIWVAAVKVSTVGLGSAGGIGFVGKVGLAGIGWVITLTLNPLFTGALVLFFFTTFLGIKVFLVEFLSWEGLLVCGCDWGQGPSFPLASGTFSSSLLRMDMDTALCSRSCMI